MTHAMMFVAGEKCSDSGYIFKEELKKTGDGWIWSVRNSGIKNYSKFGTLTTVRRILLLIEMGKSMKKKSHISG